MEIKRSQISIIFLAITILVGFVNLPVFVSKAWLNRSNLHILRRFYIAKVDGIDNCSSFPYATNNDRQTLELNLISEWLNKANKTCPECKNNLHSRARLSALQGKFQESYKIYSQDLSSGNPIWIIEAIQISRLLGLENQAHHLSQQIGSTYPSSYSSYCYFEQEDYINAAKEFEYILEIHPNDSKANHYLCRTYRELDDLSNATRYCEIAIQLDPNNSNYRVYYADILTTLGNYTEALSQTQQAVKIRESEISYRALGKALINTKFFEEAVPILKHSIYLSPTPSAYYHLGIAYINLNQKENAVLSWENALELDPNYEPAIRAINRTK